MVLDLKSKSASSAIACDPGVQETDQGLASPAGARALHVSSLRPDYQERLHRHELHILHRHNSHRDHHPSDSRPESRLTARRPSFHSVEVLLQLSILAQMTRLAEPKLPDISEPRPPCYAGRKRQLPVFRWRPRCCTWQERQGKLECGHRLFNHPSTQPDCEPPVRVE
eukprot:5601155-Amphidinium_carterae.1